ncbi:phage terminase small subunit P27 family [uncultured Paraglaciecola sp.]|uniref:phage terminase small subunit P27 family n=1 Tax=uncultured Paraglaciecola sp. TaxID=1765024 RepID=UPI0026071583|nr:phage terminase small subunit P27 family [uncultured Paraglaciecola sp.]
MDKKAAVISLDTGKTVSTSDNDSHKAVRGDLPPMPAWMGGDAKKHWEYITDELHKIGALSRLDLGVLANLCTYYEHMVAAKKALDADGMFQETPNGYVQFSPQFVAYNQSSGAYDKLAIKLGLTARSRKKIESSDSNRKALGL